MTVEALVQEEDRSRVLLIQQRMKNKEIESTKQQSAESIWSIEIFYPNDAKKPKGE